MADITRDKPSPDASTAMHASQIPTSTAGENIPAGAAVRLDANGKIMLATGAANDNKARFLGLAARAAKMGQPITVFGIGTRFGYATGLTPGQGLYLGTAPGALSDAATPGSASPVAVAVSTTDILITAYKAA